MRFNSYIALLLIIRTMYGKAEEADFEALVARLENDVLAYAREVETLYQNRCSAISLQECSQGNYDDCTSLFPNQICPGGEDLNVARCGDGVTCSALWDYTVSSVSIPKDIDSVDGRNPSDKNVIETICFTQQLDRFFIQQRDEQEEFWKSIGSRTPQMYFGSKNGAFRIYPARHGET